MSLLFIFLCVFLTFAEPAVELVQMGSEEKQTPFFFQKKKIQKGQETGSHSHTRRAAKDALTRAKVFLQITLVFQCYLSLSRT